MTFRRRVFTIYKKELIDILRDRRTLIAMIVVPIVLYPLLMLGSIQAVSIGTEEIEQEKFRIGVLNQRHRQQLLEMIVADARALAVIQQNSPPDGPLGENVAKPLDVEVGVFPSQESLDRAIRTRRIQVGLISQGRGLLPRIDRQRDITLLADLEEIRSARAHRRLIRLFNRIKEGMVASTLARRGLPETLVKPFQITTLDLSTPSSVLGQILPLVLILMTITGAIYPAIDLTAGERERGTLETLMACPIPVLDLVFGKFLVVTTVAIMGATLNLASVSATVYFGGVDQLITGTDTPLPYLQMIFILLCLIPFAVLMSAIMIAVCSYARTFKEAQNYVTPVILAVLIPGGIAALPTSRLEGVMLVIPVGNMVLFARDMLLGASIPWFKTATVLLSTTLYAASAVAVAASVFGKESVVFADAGSLRSLFSRKLIKRAASPSVSLSLLVVALWFPAWFFVQSALSPAPGADAGGLLETTSLLMPLLFVIAPAIILIYWKIDLRETFGLRIPPPIYLVAAVVIGLTAWVPAMELSALQESLIGTPRIIAQNEEALQQALGGLPVFKALLFLALVPALCEELLFRGFLLSGLRTACRRWTAIIVSAAIFGTFHFIVFKLPVTVALGVVLGYLCWQSRSIWPVVITHALHNGMVVLLATQPALPEMLGIPVEAQSQHLPAHILAIGIVGFAAGCVLMLRSHRPEAQLDALEPGVAGSG